RGVRLRVADPGLRDRERHGHVRPRALVGGRSSDRGQGPQVLVGALDLAKQRGELVVLAQIILDRTKAPGRKAKHSSLAMTELLGGVTQQRAGVGRDLAGERAGVGRLDATEDRLLASSPAWIEAGLPLAAEHALDHLLRLDGLDRRACTLGR